jgi:hypothetical protein
VFDAAAMPTLRKRVADDDSVHRDQPVRRDTPPTAGRLLYSFGSMNGIIADVRPRVSGEAVDIPARRPRRQDGSPHPAGSRADRTVSSRLHSGSVRPGAAGRHGRPAPRLARHAERQRERRLRRQRLIRLVMASCAFAVLVGTLTASNPSFVAPPAKQPPNKAPSEQPVPYGLHPGEVLSASAPSAQAAPPSASQPTASQAPAQPAPPVPSPPPPAPPAPIEVPVSGSGNFQLVPGETPVVGSGKLLRYTVELEEGLPFDASAVANMIDTTLGDARSWISTGRNAFQRTANRPDVRIVVATPETTDQLCAPLRTRGEVSCHNGEFVVLNAKRWASGVEFYNGDIDNYRRYLINHEVGHALGHGHVSCPGRGELAPVMLQQTYGLDGCLPNAWPADA